MAVRAKMYPCESGPKIICGDCVNKGKALFGDKVDFSRPLTALPANKKHRKCEICGRLRKVTRGRKIGTMEVI